MTPGTLAGIRRAVFTIRPTAFPGSKAVTPSRSCEGPLPGNVSMSAVGAFPNSSNVPTEFEICPRAAAAVWRLMPSEIWLN